MQVSEILRKIADAVEQDEVKSQPEVQPEQGAEVQATVTRARLEPVETTDQVDDAPETMVSPLQQEHELLKKSQGVDNNVSEFAGDEDEYDNELATMKQMAGIGDEQEGPVDHAADCKPASLNPRANAALEANGKPHLKHTQRRDR